MDFLQTKLPVGWKYVRLGQYVQKVTDYVASGSFASLNENVKYYKEPNYAILVKTQDFQTNFRFGLTYTDKKGYEFLENSNLFGGELILSNIGSIGKVFIVPKLDVPMSLAPNSIMIRFYSDNQIKWFYYLFSSTYGFELLDSISSGTTMRKFNKTDLKSLIAPIPPIQEQQRIAAKLDELFALIDKIEKEQEELEEYKKLAKEKVLELAVTGKLVKQDPNDEPASVLLKRIKKEKEALIKAGKIKKDKVDNKPLSDDDKNYYKNLPNGWTVCFLSEIIKEIRAGGDKPKKFSLNRTAEYSCPVIANGLENDGIVGYTNKAIVEEDCITISARGTIGVPTKRNYSFVPIVRLIVITFLNAEELIDYVKIFLTAKAIKSTGTSIQQLTVPQTKSMAINLPPLNEQCRIVKKIDSLEQVLK